METRSGVLVGEGGKSGLGLRMQEVVMKESCCTNNNSSGSTVTVGQKGGGGGGGRGLRVRGGGGMMMVMSGHGDCADDDHDHDHELLIGEDDGGGNGRGGGAGANMFCSGSNRVACFGGDIFDVVCAASGSGSTSAAAAATTDAIAVSKALHQFNSSPSSDSSPFFTFSSTNSLGAEMTQPYVNMMRIPFTAAQFQELERQTMIFKYLMASIPVPHELLIPINNRNQSTPHLSQSNSLLAAAAAAAAGSLELGISSTNNNNSSDPEPWRCKRTDGKKWRCSRDVAPDQKYCERHSHKTRPRSRKPVEVQSDPITNTTTNDNNNYSANNSLKSHFPSCTLTTTASSHSSMLPAAMASYYQPKSLEWFFKDETGPIGSNSSQEWKNLKRSNDQFQPHYREEQQLNTTDLYMKRRGGHPLQQQSQRQQLNDQTSLLLSPKSTSVEAAAQAQQAQVTRHFLDVWSTVVRQNKGGSHSASSEKSLPLSSLTLSMSGGSEINEDHSQNNNNNNNDDDQNAQVVGSFGAMVSDRDDHNVAPMAMRVPQWMAHGSWMSSPPGGPLAEALCLGISSSSSKGDSSFASTYGTTTNRS